ncbi:MAG: glycoside hydrolase family 16 protein [Ruminiclostridium sp.]|nr:glycoside hydrolase family 16 protein [Ruminiclostridium sp.]
MNKVISLLVTVSVFSACSSSNDAATVTTAPTETTTTTIAVETQPSEIIPEGYVYVEFIDGMPDGWECADGWCNGSMFNVTWRKKNITFNDEKMQLIIDNDATPKDGVPYSGGEFRSTDFYGYGRYEVSMKAIKNDGVVSSFFTYTGPSDNNPWDEIDIEILGRDTTKVQFNYFTDSQGNHEYMHDLGFDAAEDFHTYAFEWHKDKIIWYVDGTEVYRATENIPVTESKIMMNAWCGKGVDGWLNAFDDTAVPLTAEYEWIRFTPFE